MVVAEEAASTVGEVASAVADTSAAELRVRAMAEEVRVLLVREAIVVEPPGVPMELTDRDDLVELTERDPARMAAGHTVARATARDTLARMVAGLQRHQQVHVPVQVLMAAQTQPQPREITARLALIAARPQGTLRQQPVAETLRRQHPAPPAEW
jgi:hypothetical protein